MRGTQRRLATAAQVMSARILAVSSSVVAPASESDSERVSPLSVLALPIGLFVLWAAQYFFLSTSSRLGAASATADMMYRTGGRGIAMPNSGGGPR